MNRDLIGHSSKFYFFKFPDFEHNSRMDKSKCRNSRIFLLEIFFKFKNYLIELTVQSTLVLLIFGIFYEQKFNRAQLQILFLYFS